MRPSLVWMQTELDALEEQAQLRTLVPTASGDDGWLVRDGRPMLNLASNHYLGLNLDLDAQRLERLRQEARELTGTGMIPAGATASRLIAGSDPIFGIFEEEFARFKGTESCLVFGSGYTANVGTISSLVGRHDIVFSDRLNHASITDGIILSRAEHIRYRNRDPEHLESLLRKADPGKRKLIVTDTVFSMDGTIAPLREIVELKDRYGAILMVDEAHSGGLFGVEGQGLVHALGLSDRVEVQMGTFSKSYGAVGAYVTGDAVLKRYLVNKCRSLIYTTAMPPLMVHVIRENWRTARSETWRRETVQAHAFSFRKKLQSMGFDTAESGCQIVPVITGDNARTLEFSRMLQEEGIAAVAVRPPTVPDGSARIRLTLTAAHRRSDLGWALDRIGRAGKTLGLI